MKCLTLILVSIATVSAKVNTSNIIHLNVSPFGLQLPESNGPKIVGGVEAQPHAYPYQAALFLTIGEKIGFCGGSIISEDWIVSAAHCVYTASKAEVIVGAHKVKDEESTQQRFESTEFIVHSAWNPMFLSGDIALIKLPEKIKFNDVVQPIRLPRYSDIGTSLAGQKALVSGWGRDSDSATTISPILRYVESNIIRQFLCQLYYFGVPGNSHVCISGIGGKGACNGDSGGPLVTKESDGKPTLQGIVSFGIGLGCEIGWPTVFTKVSAYIPWIERNTGISIRE